MKKTAIVSCYFIRNYGSVLQAYATEKYLKKCGLPCETVCAKNLQPLLWEKKKEYYKQNRNDLPLLASKFPIICLRLLEKINWCGAGDKKKERTEAFDRFVSRFSLTEEAPSDFEELSALSSRFDTVLLGGDQLWRPDNIFPGYYTLEWVNEEIKKVSFATSFGVSVLDNKSAEHASQFLQQFSAISVREKNGCEIVKKVSGIDALQVCDPVFLLDCDEWSTLADETVCPKKKYAVCYFLGKGKTKIKNIAEICRKKGLKTVVIPNLDRYEATPKSASVCNASPEQFLGLIKNAEYIFTDSFHAAAFSAIFAKKFLMFRRNGNKKHSTDSRIISFLQMTNKMSCLTNTDEPNELISRLDGQIADRKYSHLEEEIQKTKLFLKENVLSEVEIHA